MKRHYLPLVEILRGFKPLDILPLGVAEWVKNLQDFQTNFSLLCLLGNCLSFGIIQRRSFNLLRESKRVNWVGNEKSGGDTVRRGTTTRRKTS